LVYNIPLHYENSVKYFSQYIVNTKEKQYVIR
jgi:hypothetical protein